MLKPHSKSIRAVISIVMPVHKTHARANVLSLVSMELRSEIIVMIAVAYDLPACERCIIR
jgi:hypothetical protein